MKVSIFTPTHQPTHLKEAWESIQKQTHKDWEWVVVPNGIQCDLIVTLVRQITSDDPRVKVVPTFNDIVGVGGLKNFACSKCTGDLFLELDHDDVITDDCLEVVVETAKKCPPLTFIYSDSVTEGFDGSTHTFMKEFGWRHYDWAYKGRSHVVNASHPPTPRSLCEILYAPDHVRVWTRAAYQITGGHKPEMEVSDDHDLIVRTYLKGVHFEHVPRPLYIHRLDKNTTSQKNLEKIAEYNQQIRDRNLHSLVVEWCKREKLHMFDLGGAYNCPDDFTPVDWHLPDKSTWKIDVFHLAHAVPDNSVGCFRAFDFLEHIPIGRVVPFMNMLHDKLVPGGFVLTHTPAVADAEGRVGRGAFQAPDHVSFWSENNFWYFTDRRLTQYENGEITCRFQTVRCTTHYISEWHRANFIPYVLWDGMALKDDDKNYLPGPRRI